MVAGHEQATTSLTGQRLLPLAATLCLTESRNRDLQKGRRLEPGTKGPHDMRAQVRTHLPTIHLGHCVNNLCDRLWRAASKELIVGISLYIMKRNDVLQARPFTFQRRSIQQSQQNALSEDVQSHGCDVRIVCGALLIPTCPTSPRLIVHSPPPHVTLVGTSTQLDPPCSFACQHFSLQGSRVNIRASRHPYVGIPLKTEGLSLTTRHLRASLPACNLRHPTLL